MPSKKRPMRSASLSPASPSAQQRNESSSRSAQAIAMTRCRCSGRKSPPVRARRSRNANSATSRSGTLLSMSCSRRRPAVSGTVSMSNAIVGVIRSRGTPSVRENACGKIAIAAVADDRNDGRVLDLARYPERHGERAARGDAREDALLARQPPRHLLGVSLTHVLEPVDARLVVDLGQVGLGPLADAGDLRAFLGLAADDLHLGILLLEEARAAHDGAGGAHAGDEVGERAPGVAPDLGPRALVVRQRVVGI